MGWFPCDLFESFEVSRGERLYTKFLDESVVVDGFDVAGFVDFAGDVVWVDFLGGGLFGFVVDGGFDGGWGVNNWLVGGSHVDVIGCSLRWGSKLVRISSFCSSHSSTAIDGPKVQSLGSPAPQPLSINTFGFGLRPAPYPLNRIDSASPRFSAGWQTCSRDARSSGSIENADAAHDTYPPISRCQPCLVQSISHTKESGGDDGRYRWMS